MREAGWLEWSTFAALVAVLLVVDIGYASRGERGQSVRKAWTWSLLWIGVALAFGAWIALRLGSRAGLDYLTAYVLEKSLSIDNLAVFAVVFAQTGVPPALQQRALLWGVVGALLMRALLIAFGIYALQRFHWLVYPFGALLAYAAIQTLRGEAGRKPWIEAACALCNSWVSRFIPIAPRLDGDRFLTRIDGKRFATPLLVALIAIESADLVFAIDSIPAVLSVTQDPFLVYSSNIFALLGLRALYGVVGDLFTRFWYLRVGLAALLGFVALKLMLSDVVHIPAAVSLGVIAFILAAAVIGVATAACTVSARAPGVRGLRPSRPDQGRGTDRRRLPGMRRPRRLLDAPAHVHELRPRRLLRRFEEQACHGPFRGHRPSGDPLDREGRALALVLCRPGRLLKLQIVVSMSDIFDILKYVD